MSDRKAPEGYLSPPVAARMISVGHRVIHDWIADGALQAIKMNRYSYVSEESLLKLAVDRGLAVNHASPDMYRDDPDFDEAFAVDRIQTFVPRPVRWGPSEGARCPRCEKALVRGWCLDHGSLG